MPIPRWNPATKTTRQEEMLLKRLTTKRKLFGFLRRYRDVLFDDAFHVLRTSAISPSCPRRRSIGSAAR